MDDRCDEEKNELKKNKKSPKTHPRGKIINNKRSDSHILNHCPTKEQEVDCLGPTAAKKPKLDRRSSSTSTATREGLRSQTTKSSVSPKQNLSENKCSPMSTDSQPGRSAGTSTSQTPEQRKLGKDQQKPSTVPTGFSETQSPSTNRKNKKAAPKGSVVSTGTSTEPSLSKRKVHKLRRKSAAQKSAGSAHNNNNEESGTAACSTVITGDSVSKVRRGAASQANNAASATGTSSASLDTGLNALSNPSASTRGSRSRANRHTRPTSHVEPSTSQNEQPATSTSNSEPTSVLTATHFLERMLDQTSKSCPPTPSADQAASSTNSAQNSNAHYYQTLQAFLAERSNMELPGGGGMSLLDAMSMRHILSRHSMMGSEAGKQVQQLIKGMQTAGDEGTQLTSVMEICQILVMGNEESLVGFPSKQVVPELIKLLQLRDNFEIMNHACRALTYMLDSLPRSSIYVVEAVPALLSKLQQIDCMDVAEQSLSALSTLSKRHGKRLLQQGSIQACLTYIDFFSIVAQRSALAVTANCCQQMTADDWNQVRDNLKILSDRLVQSDKKCVESACLAFTRLVENYASNEKVLKEIAAHEMLSNTLKLLMVTPSLLSSQMFTMVIHMLVVMCKRCPQLAVCLLRLNITETLVYLLCESPDQPTDLKSKRSPQEMFEIVSLIGELMPALPDSGIFTVDNLLSPPTLELKTIWQWYDDKNLWNSYSIPDCQIIESAYESEEDEISISIGGRMYTIDFQLMQQINEETSNTRKVQRLTNKQAAQAQKKSKSSTPPLTGDARAEVLAEQPNLTNHFVEHLFGILYEIYSSSAGPAVRHRCLQALLRQIYFSTPELLEDILKEQPVSSHLMSMLGSQDVKIVVAALQMSDILIRKLPETFHVKFHKHGVKYQVKHLSTILKKEQMTNKQDTSKSISTIDSTPSTSAMNTVVPLDEPDSKSKRWSRTRAQKLSKLPVLKPRAHTIDDPQELQPRANKHGAKPAERGKKSGGLMTAIRQLSRNPVPPPTENKPSPSQYQSYTAIQANNRDKIKTWISTQAKSMVDEHFSNMSEAEKNAEHILTTLSQAAAALSKNKTKSDQPNVGVALSDVDALTKLAEIITTKDVSSFEIIHSGVIESLLKYLTQDQNEQSIDNWSVREGRVKRFLNIFLCVSSDPHAFIPDPNCPLMCLLNKVMDCLHQQEQFQVKVHDLGLPGGSNGNVLRFFNTHQLTCQLERHPDCGSVKRWRDGPVKVDPLATVQAIERYLMIRGFAAPCSDDKKDSADPLTDPEEIDSDDELDDSVAAMVSAHTSGSHRLEILIGDHVLPYDMTVYQAVKNHSQFDANDEQSDHSLGQTPVWKNTHTLWYRLADATSQTNTQSSSNSKNKSQPITSSSKQKSGGKRKKDIVISSVIPCNKTPLQQLLSNNDMMKASLSDVSADTLSLCRALHSINRFWGSVYNLSSYLPVIPPANFVSVKLTAKANRQLQDPLVIMTGNIPNWLPLVAATCPFLFPFETRQLLFYVCQFDRDRALMKLQGSGTEMMDNDQNSRVQTPRTEKTKVLITRTKLLEESEKLFTSHAHKKSLLEVSFDNEAGTGLGPTLEFYSLVSKEYQNSNLQIWYDTSTPSQSEDKYVPSSNGLYPRPLAKNARAAVTSKINKKFKLIGRVLAKSIMDSRILDLPLNPILYSWLLDQHCLLSEVDLQYFDETVARSYTHLARLASRYETLNKKPQEHSSELKKISTEVEDLCLDFTWPGQSHIHLKKGGKDELVTTENLNEYLSLLSRWILYEGIHRQALALKEGFDSVFNSTQYLSKFFYPHEMEQLLCGHKSQPWTVKDLVDSCRADHGYTLDSPTLHNLFTILSEYDTHNQRLFLMFVTGSPRLPVGGFKSLNPPLTIVRKGQDDCEERSDEALPSVMTCVNYLKLPMYSSIKIMREKLDTAINMGQLSFSLS